MPFTTRVISPVLRCYLCMVFRRQLYVGVCNAIATLRAIFGLFPLTCGGTADLRNLVSRGAYDNHTPFAEDLNGVMNLMGDGPVVAVCWSMGGNWICDYIRDYGDKRLAGILLVGATTQQGTEVTQRFFGAGATDNLEGLFDSDPAINIAATKAFLRACTAAPLPPDEFSDILAYNMMVSHEARWWMLNRISDNNDVLASLSIPIMQIHGTADAIVYPFAGQYTLDHIKHDRKELKLYKDVGHSPFHEDPDRFNSDLRYFANKVFSV